MVSSSNLMMGSASFIGMSEKDKESYIDASGGMERVSKFAGMEQVVGRWKGERGIERIAKRAFKAACGTAVREGGVG